MGKETVIKIKYRHGNVPENLGGMLDKADDGDMRVLVALMMLADKETGEVAPSAVCDLIGMDEGDVKASLKLWRGAGIVEEHSSKKKAEKDEKPQEIKPADKLKTAHRDGVVELSGTADRYSARELSEILESGDVSPAFVDEAQRIMGRMFRKYDIEILVSIVERLGFEEVAVLIILNYIVGKGKKTVRYAETLAIALYDEGITETAAVADRISRMERAGEVISKIKGFYGIGDRALTASEKRFFTAWTEKYDYDAEVIKLAYDITVDKTQKPLPKYTNTIIERWYAEGLRTADEVRKYLERQESDKNGGIAKSYDTDEFFEAALQRSYEELK
ncbi:MAG: DnaD domain protein [Clostridia bacterium]|nr:DnaD domain protein [Clostridia bacterium]